MLRRGTKPAAFYRGNGLPATLRRGTQPAAGWADSTKTAPASWEWTCCGHLAVTATGKGRQQSYSGKNLLDDAAIRTYANWVTTYPGTTTDNKGYRIIAAPGTYTLSWTPASEDNFPTYFYLRIVNADGTYTNVYLTTESITRREHTFVVPDGGYAYLRLGQTSRAALFETQISKIIAIQLESGSAATAREPYVGGRPSPNPDYPQPLTGSQCTLTSSNRGGVQTSAVKLPALRAIPSTEVRDTAEYTGGGLWKITRSVGVVSSYAGESVGDVWASTTGQLSTGAEVWHRLAAPTEETAALGERETYPCCTALSVTGEYPPDVTATAQTAD